MKKLILTITTMFVFSFVAEAQTQQGSVLAGGTISLRIEKDKDKDDTGSVDGDSHTLISFAPMAGIFFADGMVAGAGLDITSAVREADDGSSKNTFTSLGIMPFFRYYHDSGLFGHAAITLGTAKSKNESGGTEVTTDFGVFNWEIGPGYAVFLNENVSVDGLLTYSSQTLSYKDSPNDFKEITSGFVLRIGFTVFIN